MITSITLPIYFVLKIFYFQGYHWVICYCTFIAYKDQPDVFTVRQAGGFRVPCVSGGDARLVVFL